MFYLCDCPDSWIIDINTLKVAGAAHLLVQGRGSGWHAYVSILTIPQGPTQRLSWRALG